MVGVPAVQSLSPQHRQRLALQPRGFRPVRVVGTDVCDDIRDVAERERNVSVVGVVAVHESQHSPSQLAAMGREGLLEIVLLVQHVA